MTEAPRPDGSVAPRPPASSGHLLRVLGAAFGIAVIVGNTIGMGILRTPGEIAAHVQSVPLFLGVWVAAGLYALLGAISLSEPGAMIPRSGGQYVIVHRALGPFPAFVVGWSDWLSTSGTIAAIALVLGEYVGPLVPALAGHVGATAAAVTLLFALLQWRGVKIGDAAQQLTSLLKTLALFGLVAAILFLPLQGGGAAATATSARVGAGLFTAIVLSLQAAIYTFDGWTGAIYFGEEIKDPGRDIPRATIGGVLVVLLIYLSLNVAFLRAVPIERMAGDPFVAGTAAAAVFGPRGDTIIRVLMIVSLMAAVNACHLMASRVPVAMSRDGLAPGAGRVNEGGTPTAALAASTLVALAFIATNTIDTVLSLLAFFFVANYALSFTSVFVLRRTEPDTPRPYRVLGYPWTTGIALAGSVAFLVSAFVGDRANTVRALLLLAASVPVFLFLRRFGDGGVRG